MATRAIRRLRSRMRAAAVVFVCSSLSLISLRLLVRGGCHRALEALGRGVVVNLVAVERAAAPAVVDLVLPAAGDGRLLREKVVNPVEHFRALLPLGVRQGEARGV